MAIRVIKGLRKGFGDSYNLRYSKGGVAKVTLYVPEDIWGDESGYQMLLDIDHNTYGYNSIIPTSGGMSGDAAELAEKYDEFEYKIPENADCALNTSNMLNGTEGKRTATITIPAGTYDWCITNPTPDDRMWIASEHGNVGGRQDDFVFDTGKHYTFTVTFDYESGYDCVDMTVEDDATLATGDETEVTGIVGGDLQSPTYTLSGLDASTYYTVYVQSVKGDNTSDWSSVNFTTTDETSIGLVDDGDNTAVITANSNEQRNVTLVGRTLYKDGNWNTLCLPFTVALEGSPLENATVMELDATGYYDNSGNATVPGASATGLHQTGLASDGTLYLYFKTATAIEAGKPYIIKWANGDDIVNPTFTDVTISNAATTVTASNSGLNTVQFIANYAPVKLDGGDSSNLYLSDGSTLYWPSADVTINAFRAYFHVALSGGAGIRAFSLHFGDDETNGIHTIDNGQLTIDNSWYDLQGRKVNSQFSIPNSNFKKGVYIHNGMKRIIK